MYSRSNSTAYEAGRLVSTSPKTLVSVIGYNSNAAAQFIQVHDAAAAPADAAVPVAFFTVPGLSNFSMDIPVAGMPFNTGIYVCNSSTGPAKTIGSADCWFCVTVCSKNK